ncbi:DUF4386 domain-containing protein [Amorphoplanes digitatis]|uniref:DUF4386 domain-containing protein n=1 Tax=Actinoplanes digitatis TaxID=1868 RepID=A0A7W7I3G7_9ACTN|nr:DUF4386 domain-containing protein [Actinoplanes digitatis]MBB4765760.1 hypothetical protein [Actinoplanes digitatis]GID93448.1 hypothetical protein Adi01nite_28600 [Actinoplanes digitatis]
MPPLIRLARQTGLLYLGLAIAGGLGFLLIRPRLFAAGDAGSTLAHLVEHEGLARAGIVLELLVVLTQALAAVWFFRLFRTVDSVAAGGIAAFGLVNAVVVLTSAALLATATEVALQPVGDAAANVQLLYLVSGNLWTVGGLFFGLWLMPMGWCVLRSGWMPRALGWILIGGGAGYVLSPFVGYLIPQAGAAVDLLALPASVGEFWMIGYLLLRGVRAGAPDGDPARGRDLGRLSDPAGARPAGG